MHQKNEKIFIIILVVCMLFTLVPIHAAETGSNKSYTVDIGIGGRYNFQSKVIYHSNYPDGTDYTISYTYNVKSYTPIYNLFSSQFQTYSDCDFSYDGYIPYATNKSWYTSQSGETIMGNIGLYSGLTYHLYAKWEKKLYNINIASNSETVEVGDEFGYEITIDNDSANDIYVNISDILPKEVSFSRVSFTDGGHYDANTHLVTWENVKVPGNGSKKIYLWVYALESGEIVNQVNVIFDDNTESTECTVVVIPKVSQTVSYRIYREYWLNGEKVATVKDSTQNGQIGDELIGSILAEKNPKYRTYTVDGIKREFVYERCEPSTSLILTENQSENVITLVYVLNEGSGVDPDEPDPIENKKINLSFLKNIDATDEDYDKLSLVKNTTYNFLVSITNQETGDVINGVLDSKDGFRVTNIPIGTYIIKEQDDIWFNFVIMVLENPMEGINLQSVNGDYILTINSTVESDSTIEINVTNKPDEDRFYDSKYDAENLFILENQNEENHSVDKVTVIVEFVDEEGNPVGTETVEGIKDSEYNVTDETKRIPEGYKPNGEPTGDPVTGIADSEKTIIVPVKIDTNETVMVTWIDEDGTTVLDGPKTFNKGESEPTTDAIPTKAEDEDYTYDFDKWERSEDADGNIIYKACYTATPKQMMVYFTIQYYDMDGNIVKSETMQGIVGETINVIEDYSWNFPVDYVIDENNPNNIISKTLSKEEKDNIFVLYGEI